MRVCVEAGWLSGRADFPWAGEPCGESVQPQDQGSVSQGEQGQASQNSKEIESRQNARQSRIKEIGDSGMQTKLAGLSLGRPVSKHVSQPVASWWDCRNGNLGIGQDETRLVLARVVGDVRFKIWRTKCSQGQPWRILRRQVGVS